MKPLNEAVALRPPDPCFAVFDLFKLEEQFVWMPIWFATVFAPVVREDVLDLGVVFFEEG